MLASLLAGALVAVQTGCSQQNSGGATGADQTESASAASGENAERPVSVAVAELQPTADHTAHGTVTFTQVDEGIRVVAEIQGLTGGPGERGFHIHETGDCSAPDASSAGGHFNPTGMDHGAPDDDERHAGDFGNLTVNADGVGTADFIDTHISFSGSNSIVGRAVIVHAGTDDLTSQPSGNAGPRAACGVIQVLEY